MKQLLIQYTIQQQDGKYCLDKLKNKIILFLSYLSPDILPSPTFVLQQQTDVWHLLCTGSPSYPGASFAVYLVDSELPVATQQAKAIDHQACFPVPVQDSPVALYQCQYSVHLGSYWSHSERSPPLAVTKGTHYPCECARCCLSIDFFCSLSYFSEIFFASTPGTVGLA